MNSHSFDGAERLIRDAAKLLNGPNKGKANGKGHPQQVPPPEMLTVTQTKNADVAAPTLMIENVLPATGAVLLNGASKAGKTLLAVQIALSVASGRALVDNYRVLEKGPSMLVEQDDSGAVASVKDILNRCGVSDDVPFYLVPRVPWCFGPELLAWMEEQIKQHGLRLIVLDSYTALRGARTQGLDIVKAEQYELAQLDALGKRTKCLVVVIHHASKASATLDWSVQAAGTFAMTQATEAQIHVSRFAELEGAAPERLVRVRGRHVTDVEMVLRFRKQTLDYEHVLEGGASSLYPLLRSWRDAFRGEPFSPKSVCHETGVSRATAHRQIERLYHANAIRKQGYGEYVLVAG